MKSVKYIFLLVGALMLFGSFKFYSNTKDFLEVAITAEGSVINFIADYSNESSTYRPVFEFSTKNGEILNITSSSSSNPPSYSVGESVEVLYEEAYPSEAIINGYFSLWGLPTILGILGAVFFIIGLGIIIYPNLKQNKHSFKRNRAKIELEPEVIAAIESGKKVVAIKKLRKIRDLGLKESKELIDLYSAQNKSENSSTSSHPDASSGSGAKIGFIMVFGAICYFVYKFAL